MNHEDKIIPLRPREQVFRRITRFRSDAEDIELRMGLWPRIRLHGSVNAQQVIRGLGAAGCDWKLDERTQEIVAFPRQGERP